jgi:hypothetical protein
MDYLSHPSCAEGGKFARARISVCVMAYGEDSDLKRLNARTKTTGRSRVSKSARWINC